MEQERIPDLPQELTFWPNHWAGGWGPNSVLPNRIRIYEKDKPEELAYIEHHGSSCSPWNVRSPTEQDYRFAMFLLHAYNSYRKHCGPQGFMAAKNDLLGECLNLLREANDVYVNAADPVTIGCHCTETDTGFGSLKCVWCKIQELLKPLDGNKKGVER
jgi:hypothetical protein